MSAHRLVVFFTSSFPSHILGAMGVARRLQSMGFDVEYWGGADARKLIVGQGFRHSDLTAVRWCYEPLWPGGWYSALREPRTCIQALRRAAERMRDFLDELDRFERALDARLRLNYPTLIVLEPLVVGYFPLLSARGLKCVLLQDKPLPSADELVPPPVSPLVPNSTWSRRAFIRWLWAAERFRTRLSSAGSGALVQVGLYQADRLIAEVLARSDGEGSSLILERRVRYDLYFQGLTEWVLGAPQMDLPRARPLPEHTRYIGPCVDTERREGALPPRQKHLRLIYVSMGSAVPHWTSDMVVLKRTLRALCAIPGTQLLVSTGSMRARSELRNDFPGAVLYRHVPQLCVLKEAALAVTHGGANTFRECVVAGTPMLVIPRDHDQPGNSARIIFHRLGLRVGRSFGSVRETRRKAMTILSDERFAARVRQVGRSVSDLECSLLEAALSAALGKRCRVP